ncbi:MAG: DUF4956 domain-containing protein [Flavobacteriales bacterium]|nr:DUF4956 domain-containing protein [Flavobacteriales bacterium]MCX7768853.1 DUF4956 domain-containing protein [Flavobacteriales bacterium]MDW8410873.1 DUF4956 domain-containing protein [Flavobacteriales bacterium]
MEDVYIFGIRLLDIPTLQETLFKFIINFITAFVLVKFLYYRLHKRREYFFTFLLFNVLIFFVCLLLNSVKIKMGFAFGLFALFGLLRYRTGSLPLKEMTYLFAVIVVAVVNALMNERISISEIFFFNVVIITVTALTEYYLGEPDLSEARVRYANLDLLLRGSRQDILKDLREKTGLPVVHFQIDEWDTMRSFVELRIFYQEKRNGR